MAILRYICALFPALILTGCYEDFTPDVDTTPVLCLNSLITAGEPIKVNVSHTWLYTDDGDSDHSVNDAVISIYANGMRQNTDYIPQAGDRIRIVAESNVYGSAEAEVTVPRPVPVCKLEWQTNLNDIWKSSIEFEMLAHFGFNLNVELTIDDPVADENYYRLSYNAFSKDIESVVSFSSGSFDYDSEPIFAEHIGVFESIMGGDSYGFTFFTDRQFSGRSYTLHLHYKGCSYFVNSQEWLPELLECGLVFTLHSVSRSYYSWANYLWQNDNGPLGDISDAGLGDPLRGYSNVSTGAGVVAAQSVSTYTLDLKDFIEQVLVTN